MSVLHRNRKSPKTPADPADTAAADPTPATILTPATSTEPAAAPAPRTRTGATWVGISAAVLTLVVLIVILLQNTGSVAVSFLWMDGSVPLAPALLIAGVGIGAMVVGTVRSAS